MRTVVKSKVFYFFDLIVHAINLILLMSLHFPQIPNYDQILCKYIILYSSVDKESLYYIFMVTCNCRP